MRAPWILPGWLIAFLVVAGIGLSSTLLPIPAERLAFDEVASLTISDRHGIPLRQILSEDRGTAWWVGLDEISPHAVAATIAVEDARFRSHPGFDVWAIARAVVQNVRAGRIVSGGSTITQQVVRSIYDVPRSPAGKLAEIWLAMRLEATLSKDEILEHYLNRVPYGNQAFGIEAASRTYFDKPASDLTISEAALLVGLPQAPSIHDPLRHWESAVRRRESVLEAMLNQGGVTRAVYEREVAELPRLVPASRPFLAPHFVRHILSRSAVERSRREIRTTLDIEIQEAVEALVKGYVDELSRESVTNAGAIVLDTETCEVLAWVGSGDFWSAETNGQVDVVVALRQPGSTLKPFTYGLAFERGFTAASVLRDIPTYIPCIGGDYMPRNYDGTFHGPVRVRPALACSYNVPAVRALMGIDGAGVLLERLHKAGFGSLDRPPAFYDIGLTLGAGEVTLLELARAYSAIGRGGNYRSEVVTLSEVQAEQQDDMMAASIGTKVFNPAVAFLIRDILSDDQAREPAFGRNGPLVFAFDCAAKTGTSKDFRDSWCVGFTSSYTVGVWIGNFDGAPMAGVSGAAGAARVFRDVMLSLHRNEDPEPFTRPPGLVSAEICVLSGLRPGPYCRHVTGEWFLEGTAPERVCDWHVPSGDGERVVVNYPPEYCAWAEREGILDPVHAASAKERQQPSLESGDFADIDVLSTGQIRGRSDPTRFVIAFPDNGDVFAIDPVLRQEFQTVNLEAVVPPDMELLTWIMDGTVIARVSAPFVVAWQLEGGEHRLSAEGRRRDGTVAACGPVRFTVRGTSKKSNKQSL